MRYLSLFIFAFNLCFADSLDFAKSIIPLLPAPSMQAIDVPYNFEVMIISEDVPQMFSFSFTTESSEKRVLPKVISVFHFPEPVIPVLVKTQKINIPFMNSELSSARGNETAKPTQKLLPIPSYTFRLPELPKPVIPTYIKAPSIDIVIAQERLLPIPSYTFALPKLPKPVIPTYIKAPSVDIIIAQERLLPTPSYTFALPKLPKPVIPTYIKTHAPFIDIAIQETSGERFLPIPTYTFALPKPPEPVIPTFTKDTLSISFERFEKISNEIFAFINAILEKIPPQELVYEVLEPVLEKEISFERLEAISNQILCFANQVLEKINTDKPTIENVPQHLLTAESVESTEYTSTENAPNELLEFLCSNLKNSDLFRESLQYLNENIPPQLLTAESVESTEYTSIENAPNELLEFLCSNLKNNDLFRKSMQYLNENIPLQLLTAESVESTEYTSIEDAPKELLNFLCINLKEHQGIADLFVFPIQKILITESISQQLMLAEAKKDEPNISFNDFVDFVYAKLDCLNGISFARSEEKVPPQEMCDLIAIASETPDLMTVTPEEEYEMQGTSNAPTQDYQIEVTPEEDYYLNPNLVHVILEPVYRATISAQITSPVIAIEKRMGQSFKAGDVLIKLDDTIYNANLQKAIAIYKHAKLNYEMRQQLFEDDVGSLTELKEATASFATANADVSLARKQLDACTILAPYRGRVVQLHVEEYELAEANRPLIDIIGDEVLIAKMLIESSQLPNVAIGDVIKIKFTELNMEIPAKIIRIGAEIDPASSTIRVDAQIENENLMLTAGMTGTAILPNKNPQKQEPEETTPRINSSKPGVNRRSLFGPQIQISPTFSNYDPIESPRKEEQKKQNSKIGS